MLAKEANIPATYKKQNTYIFQFCSVHAYCLIQDVTVSKKFIK